MTSWPEPSVCVHPEMPELILTCREHPLPPLFPSLFPTNNRSPGVLGQWELVDRGLGQPRGLRNLATDVAAVTPGLDSACGPNIDFRVLGHLKGQTASSKCRIEVLFTQHQASRRRDKWTLHSRGKIPGICTGSSRIKIKCDQPF